jgi:hypothetical protein
MGQRPEHRRVELFLPSRPRKEIAQLQQSFALLAVRRKFLEFYCDLVFFPCPLTPGFSKTDGANATVFDTDLGTNPSLAA